jgi:broad specificity phosphatase PhoE
VIYLVRHGQTEFNAAARFQGQLDSPLTALGREQARLMGQTLRGLIDPKDVAMFSSPLGRAAETARIVRQAAGVAEEIVFDRDLVEVGMGAWDGLTDFEIDTQWPDARKGLNRHEWFFHSPDGETYAAFSERLRGALDRIGHHPAAARIIVSHGVTGRVLQGLYAGLETQDALRLQVPQDVIFCLKDGRIGQISCAD